jgi:uncharacterized protein YqgC (DUF456 family)
MQSEPSSYKPGHSVVLGTIIGAFIGLLVGKFAIGLIFGFFVGIAIDSRKRNEAESATRDRTLHENEPEP